MKGYSWTVPLNNSTWYEFILLLIKNKKEKEIKTYEIRNIIEDLPFKHSGGSSVRDPYRAIIMNLDEIELVELKNKKKKSSEPKLDSFIEFNRNFNQLEKLLPQKKINEFYDYYSSKKKSEKRKNFFDLNSEEGLNRRQKFFEILKPFNIFLHNLFYNRKLHYRIAIDFLKTHSINYYNKEELEAELTIYSIRNVTHPLFNEKSVDSCLSVGLSINSIVNKFEDSKSKFKIKSEFFRDIRESIINNQIKEYLEDKEIIKTQNLLNYLINENYHSFDNLDSSFDLKKHLLSSIKSFVKNSKDYQFVNGSIGTPLISSDLMFIQPIMEV
ncbi:MAG: hypothetical protein K9W44_10855 [Candidatus Lokiarchaeota archaeon]|nr:hypothetical protein [Candidatus Harpocratesius repetitus]